MTKLKQTRKIKSGKSKNKSAKNKSARNKSARNKSKKYNRNQNNNNINLQTGGDDKMHGVNLNRNSTGNSGSFGNPGNNNNKYMSSNPPNMALIDGEMVYRHYKKKDDSTFSDNRRQCMCINYKSDGDFNTYDRCGNNALDGSHFCPLHQNCKSYLKQFLSGSEYEDDTELWSNPYIEGSHNCYSYFLNTQVLPVRDKCAEICNTKYKSTSECINQSGCTNLKPQPGSYVETLKKGHDNDNPRIYKCPEMQQKILKDNPTIKPIDFNKRCPSGYYKGAMVVDSKNSKSGNTYHFYKQVADGRFLHKPGINPVSAVDSPFEGEKGREILIPHFARRDYSKPDREGDEGIFYNGFCGYYCVPRNDIEHKNLV